MSSHSPARAGLVVAIVLLISVLAVLLLNLVPLVANAGSVLPRSRAVNRGVTSQVPLADVSARADERIGAWAGDAYLVRAEAAWYIGPDWQSLEVPPVAWALNYYSPVARSMATVVIDDETLLWVPPMEIPVTPRSLAAFPPAQGVEVAWLTFRAAAGDAFLSAHPDAQVNFRLQQKETGPVWTVSAYGAGEFARVLVDAQSGVLLGVEE